MLEYVRSGEVMNNNKIGFGVEVNPEIENVISQKSLSDIERQTCTMVSGTALDLNKTLLRVKFSIYHESHIIINIIFNVQG